MRVCRLCVVGSLERWFGSLRENAARIKRAGPKQQAPKGNQQRRSTTCASRLGTCCSHPSRTARTPRLSPPWFSSPSAPSSGQRTIDTLPPVSSLALGERAVRARTLSTPSGKGLINSLQEPSAVTTLAAENSLGGKHPNNGLVLHSGRAHFARLHLVAMRHLAICGNCRAARSTMDAGRFATVPH
jgi:hypothetical protein